MHIVVKKKFQNSDKYIYSGSREDCEFVRTVLEKYYQYNKNVAINVIGMYTEFNNIENFIEKYRYEYDALREEGKL